MSSKHAFCVAITHNKEFFIGSAQDIQGLIADQDLKQKVWQPNPHGLDAFLKQNPEYRELVYKAIHYWALCDLKRVEFDEKAYGKLKRALSDFGDKLYRRVRNIAQSVAAIVKKAFPSKKRQERLLQKTLHHLKQKGNLYTGN